MIVSRSPLAFGDPDCFEECRSGLLYMRAVCLVCVQTLSLVSCCFSHDETELQVSGENSQSLKCLFSHPVRTVLSCAVFSHPVDSLPSHKL